MFDYTKTVVGLDVHKESIVAAVLPPKSERTVLTAKFENTPAALKTFLDRLRSKGPLTFVYEAGPCGYQVHRDLTAQGTHERHRADRFLGCQTVYETGSYAIIQLYAFFLN